MLTARLSGQIYRVRIGLCCLMSRQPDKPKGSLPHILDSALAAIPSVCVPHNGRSTSLTYPYLNSQGSPRWSTDLSYHGVQFMTHRLKNEMPRSCMGHAWRSLLPFLAVGCHNSSTMQLCYIVAPALLYAIVIGTVALVSRSCVLP